MGELMVDLTPPKHVASRSVIPPAQAAGKDSFFKRLISALVLLPMAIVPTYLGGWWFTSLIMLCAVLMLQEWHTITQGRPSRGLFYEEVTAVLLAAVFMGLEAWPYAIGVLVLGALVAHILGAALSRPLPWPGLGVLYVGLPILALLWLRAQPETGLIWIAWIFLVVWSTDILAYIFGRTLGGPKLVPKFSPKKTWSGLIGGMIGAALASVSIGLIYAPNIHWLLFVGIGAIGAVVAQVGDISESMLKRRFSVKDSGRLIPGHGGILDRVDGLITTACLMAPAVAVAKIFGMLS